MNLSTLATLPNTTLQRLCHYHGSNCGPCPIYTETFELLFERKKQRGARAVYFIHNPDNDTIKIGSSGNIPQRLATHKSNTGSPLELLLVIPGSYAVEHAIHAHFADLHVNSEWFRDDPRIRDAIALLQAVERALDSMHWYIEPDDDTIAPLLRPCA